MNDQELDRLFERFRRRGDVPALGAIFDATAPELLRVAMSLVREPGEADDLLQETFLTAIERSERYEAGRRLVPWLLGILVLHARERRARRRRELDPARLAPRESPAPEAHALGHELEQELERALAELSARERGVLEAYLCHGKGAAEIANETGAAPGAVRMQIHRGLDRLRRLLPAGLALGAAGSASAQGMDAVRARVLRAGETATKNLAPGAGSAPGAGLAGALMGKKLVVAGVVAALAGAWFLVEGAGRAPGGERGEVARAEAPAPPRERPALAQAPQEEPRSTAIAAEPPGAGASRAPLVPAADPDLAVLRGRVVEHDGQPVAGVPVALIEVQETEIHATPLDAVGPPSYPRLLAASGVTGADGVFELCGASAHALHGLGVDLGGERATLRMLDVLLAPGLTTELGDVVLAATGALAGRVVDERGQPVAGARVRVGAIPELALELGLHHIGAGGALTELPSKGDPTFVFEVPHWASELESKLPLATTTTDGEGRFSLGRAPAGRLTALVDAAGFARLAAPSLDLGAGARHDLGELVLEGGASARGRVLDSAGRPVARAELRAGTLGARDSLAVFGPIVATDGEGRFAVEHLPGVHGLAVIGRRDASSPWVCADEEDGEFVLRLRAEGELVAEVVDAAGAAVRAPRFFLRPGRDVSGLGPLAPALRPFPARAVEGEPGRFRLGPLAHGTYLVVARAAGLADARATVELGSEAPPVLQLRLGRSNRAEIAVREKATGSAVPGALVRVLDGPMQPLASARTGAEGRAWLDLPDDSGRELWLVAEHPRHAPSGLALDASRATETDPIVVELSEGARLVVRLDDPVLAAQRCMLQLWYAGGTSPYEFRLPRFCAVPSEGALELEHLAPGRWSWNLFESLSGADVLGFFSPERVPQSLASGNLELAEGRTFELSISGKPARESAGLGASLSGIVRVEGRLAGELEVQLARLEETDDEPFFTEGHGGRFRFDDVPPGDYLLSVSAPGAGIGAEESRELVREIVELTGTEDLELEFDVVSLQAQVSVRTAEDEPAGGVELVLLLMGEGIVDAQATTDEEGRARLVLPRAGRYSVFATEREQGAARAEFEVAPGGANELALQLSRGVECAGRLRLEPGARLGAESAELLVSPEDNSWFRARVPVELVDGTAPFRLVGLAPGKYKVLLWSGDEMLHARFELPEGGDGDLELRFSAGRGRR